jgi:lipopolysaccharide biosynthesis protein
MNRLIIFAHWDASAEVKPYILTHLKALKALGGEVEFVSNCPLPPAEVDKLRGLTRGVRLRENVGYDFGMWKDALAHADLSRVDEVVLANSSVIGPFFPLAPIFERMNATGWDFWGMTESWTHVHHVQSFFVVLRHAVVHSIALARFFETVMPYRSKDQVILAYELGLSTWLWENGFTGGAAFPPNSQPRAWLADLLVRHTRPWVYRKRKNPTLYYPDRLWRAGMPYLKVDLFRRKPVRTRLLGLSRIVEGRPDLAF